MTNGPGLEPCLWVGVNFAKVLSYFWNVPVVAVKVDVVIKLPILALVIVAELFIVKVLAVIFDVIISEPKILFT